MVSIYGNRKFQNLAKKLGIPVEVKKGYRHGFFVVVDRLISPEAYEKLREELQKKEGKKKIAQERLQKENEKIKDYIKKRFTFSDEEIEDIVSRNQVGAGTIFRKRGLSLEEKVTRAIVAWIRHKKTNYEEALRLRLGEAHTNYLWDPDNYDSLEDLRREQKEVYEEVKEIYTRQAEEILKRYRRNGEKISEPPKE